MQRNRFFGAFFSALCFAVSLSLLSAQEHAEWPADCRVGIFLPFFPDGNDADRLQREFRVERFADQVASTGADYFGMAQYRYVGWENPPQPSQRQARNSSPDQAISGILTRI